MNKPTPGTSPTKVAELYGLSTLEPARWGPVVAAQECPFLLPVGLSAYRICFHHSRGQGDGDPMQFHVYELRKEASRYVLHLKDRLSTDVPGTARCLGQRADMKVEKVELRTMLEAIQAKLSQSTLLTVEGALPVPETADREADDES